MIIHKTPNMGKDDEGFDVPKTMSNLTSASGEARASSGNRTEIGTDYSQQYFTPPPTQTQPPLKKKRNLPGNPEPSCVHHEPSRALGDLTGIKKHFCRKHGEKKWKCDKCSKKYAVQSDWKAHSKTCGTREYRCDCGTLFSRRDSFITHRAFCDALAEESARSVTGIVANSTTQPTEAAGVVISSSSLHQDMIHASNNNFPLKKEQQGCIPHWLGQPSPSSASSSFLFSHQDHHLHENPNPRGGPTLLPPPYHQTAPHMSATALLQKAAQMGATMSKTGSMIRTHQQQAHVSANAALNLSSRDHQMNPTPHDLLPFGNNKAVDNGVGVSPSLLHHVINSFSSSPFEGTFEDTFGGGDAMTADEGGGGGAGGNNNEGLTRDFLGLRHLSHTDILNIAGVGNCMNSSQHNQTRNPWQG
ncbi:hypothetical protein JHK85_038910 [Glycine max]|nr:hypothetical protein JHK85_038910 [Glycine max]